MVDVYQLKLCAIVSVIIKGYHNHKFVLCNRNVKLLKTFLLPNSVNLERRDCPSGEGIQDFEFNYVLICVFLNI